MKQLYAAILKRLIPGALWLLWRVGLYPQSRPTDTPGRLYLEQFIGGHAAQCHGTFLEFGDPRYRHMFAPDSVARYDVINPVPGPQVTLIGDIQGCPQIADASYDVIVCTQVLEHVPNPFLAAEELCRILKPGGVLLLTAPAAFPYHRDPLDYWRFSVDSLALLFGDRLDCTIRARGNRLTVMAPYWLWGRGQLPPAALAHDEPECPYLITLAGRRRLVDEA